jgi:hypothetical protein
MILSLFVLFDRILYRIICENISRTKPNVQYVLVKQWRGGGQGGQMSGIVVASATTLYPTKLTSLYLW